MNKFADVAPVIDSDAGEFPPRISGLAIATLICGVLSIVFSIFTAFFACVLGVIAIITINKSDGQLKGKGLAITGIILSALFSIVSITAMWFVRENARESVAQNNLRLLALAMHNYESVNQHFPTDILDKETGEPLLSWRVAILPQLESGLQYEQFRLDEPWDSPTNLEAAKNMPDVFNRPGAGTKEGHTIYQRPIGNGAAFDPPRGNKPVRIQQQDFRDGTSNTIFIVETTSDAAVFWTEPADYKFDPGNPFANLGASKFGWLLFSMADGSSLKTKKNLITSEQLKLLFTRADGEFTDIDSIKRLR